MMLIFIDESGDTGFKFESGSSRFFILTLVVFSSPEVAYSCETQIRHLFNEMGGNAPEEFHFKKNSDFVRESFLELIKKQDFKYYACAIDKSTFKWPPATAKQELYEKAYNLLFSEVLPEIKDAIVVTDESGDSIFQRNLDRYLKKIAQVQQSHIKKIKSQKSRSNLLLQLTDYVAGVVHRFVAQKHKNAMSHYRFIHKKEGLLLLFPSKKIP